MPPYRIRPSRPTATTINVPDTYSYAAWNGTGFPTDPGANADQAIALRDWLRAQPAGTESAPVIIRFPYRRVFHVQLAMLVAGKNYWTVDYNECWFVRDKELWGDETYVPKVNTIGGWEDGTGPATPGDPREFYKGDTFFDWQDAVHQKHINGRVRGSNRIAPLSDVVITDLTGWESRQWTTHTEGNHAMRWTNVQGIHIENMHHHNVWGDPFILGGEQLYTRVEYVLMKDCIAKNAGRQLVTPASSYDVLIDNVTATHGWAIAFDTEVNGNYTGQITDVYGTPRYVQGPTKVEIRNCTARARTALVAVGSQGARDLYVHHNTVLFNNPSRGGFSFNNGPVTGIRIEDNTFSTSYDAWALELANATGYNSFRRNTIPANFTHAIILGTTPFGTNQGGPVSGTLAVDGNDMPGYTNLYRDDNVGTLVRSPNCGNRITAGGAFNVPVAC